MASDITSKMTSPSMDLNQARDHLRSISIDRVRAGKAPFSLEEIKERLERIRDGALAWMEMCVVKSESKGCGAAQLMFEKATQELDRLSRVNSSGTATGGVKIRIEGLDPSAFEFGPAQGG